MNAFHWMGAILLGAASLSTGWGVPFLTALGYSGAAATATYLMSYISFSSIGSSIGRFANAYPVYDYDRTYGSSTYHTHRPRHRVVVSSPAYAPETTYTPSYHATRTPAPTAGERLVSSTRTPVAPSSGSEHLISSTRTPVAPSSGSEHLVSSTRTPVTPVGGSERLVSSTRRYL